MDLLRDVVADLYLLYFPAFLQQFGYFDIFVVAQILLLDLQQHVFFLS